MSPVDLVEAARAAVFVRLDAAGGVPVFDHMPQDTQPPFRQIGEVDWGPADSKFDSTLRVTIELITIYRGEDRAELAAIVNANRTALHEQTIEADGAIVQQLVEVAGSISSAASDGVTYAAVQHFEMEVEPA